MKVVKVVKVVKVMNVVRIVRPNIREGDILTKIGNFITQLIIQQCKASTLCTAQMVSLTLHKYFFHLK